MAAVAQPKQAVVFPEVIEETRTVGDKVTTVKYALGKILGKVIPEATLKKIYDTFIEKTKFYMFLFLGVLI